MALFCLELLESCVFVNQSSLVVLALGLDTDGGGRGRLRGETCLSLKWGP